ncbi:MAG: FHA domain-containing protein [Candidatus Lambdaproteobacteria bacterium]|nr:FHA domain-containing protein [Candidatus Lambdaproteobacteria bacterium]
MSWRSVSVRAHGRRVLLAGVVAGLWSAVAVESLGFVPGLAGHSLWQAAAMGALLGLPLGLLLAPADSLSYRLYRRALRAALAGAVVAAALGALGFAASAWVYGLLSAMPRGSLPISPLFSFVLLMSLAMGLLGAGVGWASALRPGSWQPHWARIKTGLVSGFAVAVPLAVALHLLARWPWTAMIGLALWGGIVSLALFWKEKRFARRWLRVLTGSAQEQIYPLSEGLIRLGKAEANDVPLRSFEEIYPFHCQMNWNVDHFEIVDSEQGGMVLVNFRQVQAQPLKHGDLVKIGSALLQYGEAS